MKVIKLCNWYSEHVWPCVITVFLGIISCGITAISWINHLVGCNKHVRVTATECSAITIIPLIVLGLPFIIAGIADVFPSIRSWVISQKEGLLRKKIGKPLIQIPKGELQPVAVASGVTTIDSNLAEKVCREVVSDSLRRKIADDESCNVLESFPLQDRSVLVIFRYRKHIRRERTYGNFDDEIHSSVHLIRLKLNQIGDFISVRGLMSLNAKEFEDYDNPREMISNLVRESVLPLEISAEVRQSWASTQREPARMSVVA